MYSIKLNTNFARVYANNGQHAEQVARFTLTGELVKADNKPFTAGGDIGDLQVKSARATVCKGTDIKAHIELDGANSYGYVMKDLSKMVIMSPEEWVEFCSKFSTITHESPKNGGAEKLRLLDEPKKMREWLERA